MITIDPKRIAHPLQTAASVVEKTTSLPVLNHLLLRCDNGVLRLTGSDMETTITAAIDVQHDAAETCTLPSRKLQAIIAAAQTDPIRIEINQDHALIRSGKARFRLSTLPADTYPLPELDPDATSFDLPGAVLVDLLHHTRDGMAINDARYYLNGLLLELEDNTLTAVATNGHRLHQSQIIIDTQQPARQIIIPRKAVELIQKIPMDAMVRITLHSRGATFEAGPLCLHTKLIDGKYPDYHKVIPNTDPPPCITDNQRLLDAIKRCTIINGPTARAIRLTTKPGKIELETRNEGQEMATDEIAADYDGPVITFGVDADYLYDATQSMKSENIVVMIKDSDTAALIKPVDTEEKRLAVLMPMRL